jgi:hypothetical protein
MARGLALDLVSSWITVDHLPGLNRNLLRAGLAELAFCRTANAQAEA